MDHGVRERVADYRYPQLLRTSHHRWWKPLVGIVFSAVLIIMMGVGVVLAAVAALAASGLQRDPFSTDAIDPATPFGLLGINLAIATFTPAVLLTVVVVHRQHPGVLASVTGRLRSGFLSRLLLVGLVLGTISFFLTGWLLGPDGEHGDPPVLRTLLGLLLVVLLTTPLQSAAEELAFRGYLTQALSSWFARPGLGALVAAGVTAFLFALMHGVQDPWLFGDRVVFGLAASWLVWRTGGLEAAIALHVANNLVALVAAVLTGSIEAALTATTVDWRYAVADVVTVLMFAAVADRLARRWGVAVVSREMPVGYPGKRLEHPASAERDGQWGMG